MNEHQQQPFDGQSSSTVWPSGEPTEQSEVTTPPAAEPTSMAPPGEELPAERIEETGAPPEAPPRESPLSIRALLGRLRDTCRKPLEHARHARDARTVIRLSDEARSKVDTLIAGGLFETRSETTAFLIEEGIHAQESLIRDVEQKMRQIEALHSELRSAHQNHG